MRQHATSGATRPGDSWEDLERSSRNHLFLPFPEMQAFQVHLKNGRSHSSQRGGTAGATPGKNPGACDHLKQEGGEKEGHAAFSLDTCDTELLATGELSFWWSCSSSWCGPPHRGRGPWPHTAGARSWSRPRISPPGGPGRTATTRSAGRRWASGSCGL